MNKFKWVFGIIAIAVIAAGVFVWLQLLPNFIAGQVSNNRVQKNDYYIAQFKGDKGSEYVMKLDRAQLGKGAIREAWLAMIPALLFGLPVAWYLGRFFMDNEHKVKADYCIERNNRLIAEREKKADGKCARAETLTSEAKDYELRANQSIQNARQALCEAKKMENAAREQIDLANSRADEAERKLLKERENHKKVHAQLIRYKEKANGPREPA